MKKYKKEILIFLIIFTCYAYFFHLSPHANSLTRYNLVRAIVYEGKLNIDSYHENTVDKSLYKGHYYSDKAIGTSLFALIPSWLIKISKVSFGINLIYYLLRVISVSLPSAIFAALFFKFLTLFNPISKYNIWLTFALFLGTLCYPYSTLFYGHQQAAIFCFISFSLIYLFKNNYISANFCLLSVGFLSGLAVITEYTSGIIILLLFAYLIVNLKKKSKILIYFLSSAPPLLLLLTYNYLCFENPFNLGYSFQAPEIAVKAMARGHFGFGLPNLSILYKILFSSYRGLFYTSPVLLLSIPGFYYIYQDKNLRAEFYICLFSTLSFILLNASFAAWHGGYGIGPRYIIPALPFMVFPILFIFNKNKYYFKIFIFLSLVSIAIMFLAVIVDPEIPQFIDNPIVDYLLPNILNNNIDYNIGYYIFSNLDLINIVPLFIILLILSILLFFHKKTLNNVK
ncbi:MAG: hypothetical protein QMD92_00740 [bacterium]|nr:hypothetical protein [bacterium]